MYGTVARLKVKEDAIDDVKAWAQDDRRPDGGVAAYVFKSDDDPQEFFLVAIFEDKASYRANAEDPETQQSFAEWSQFLAAEPQWNDGEVVMASNYR